MLDRAQTARADEGRRPLRVLAALSLADPGDNRDNRDTIAALRELPVFTVAEAIVRRRKAVANAMAVAEMQPLDRQARDRQRWAGRCSPSSAPWPSWNHP
jgi:hypothetical protein